MHDGEIIYHHFQNLMAPIASGSFLTDGMVICPCSGSTLGAVVHGTGENLIHRAASVHLKERRKLIVVPRETPLSTIQLDNMRRAAEAGAVVLPAMPGFYHGVTSIRDLVDFVVARICDQLGIDNRLDAALGRTRANHAATTAPHPGDDPLQPHAVCAAVCAVRGGDGLDGRRAQRAAASAGGGRSCWASCCAWSRPAARRWPSIGWPTGGSTRDNPRTAIAAHSGRHAVRWQRGRVCRRLFDRVCRWRRCLFLPNRLPLYLVAAGAGVSVGYSFTKRFTAAAHFWLGAALMLAPISAWIAIRGAAGHGESGRSAAGRRAGRGGAVVGRRASTSSTPARMSSSTVAAGLHSVPARLGVAGRCGWRRSVTWAWSILLAAAALGLIRCLGWIYGAGVAAVAVLLAYEHWLVRPDDLTRVNVAFFQVNAVVSIGLFLVGSLDLLTSAKLLG